MQIKSTSIQYLQQQRLLSQSATVMQPFEIFSAKYKVSGHLLQEKKIIVGAAHTAAMEFITECKTFIVNGHTHSRSHRWDSSPPKVYFVEIFWRPQLRKHIKREKLGVLRVFDSAGFAKHTEYALTGL